jgi:uncharacterized delta-60 repeat protein
MSRARETELQGLKLLLVTFAAAAALALPGAAFGAAGDLDPSFDGDGKLTTAFGTTPFHPADSGNGAARLATGEVYVAGTTPGAGSDSDFALVRFTAAGVLDTTFGGGDGIVITDLSGTGSDDLGNAVSVNTNTGNVVVAGSSSPAGSSDDDDFAVARYTSTGVLDSAFGGGDGIVITDVAAGRADTGFAVAHVDPTSSGSNIIVGGETEDIDTSERDFALVAYTSAGALDTGFDGDGGSGDGKVTTDFGSADDFIQAVRVSGSEILAAGGTDPAGDDRGDFALARYSASTGELDDTTTPFGTGGKQTVSFSSNPSGGNGDNATALTTDGTGKIVVAGFAGPGNGDFAVARLDGSTGAPDNTFDTDGKQTVTTPASGTTLNSQDQCYAVAVQTDGKILLAGSEFSQNHWMLARMSDTGVPDSGFDTDGILLTEFGPTPSGGTTFAAAVSVDATTIVAGGTGDDNFAAVRYATADGALDTTFGVGGKAEADVPHPVQSSETATGVAVQPNGKVVAVGPTDVDAITQTGGDRQFGLARYNLDGTLDADFGAGGVDGNGRVSTNFDSLPSGGGTDDSATAVGLQPDGKLVVAGTTASDTDPGDFAVARYNADGSLDTTFAPLSTIGAGKLTTDFGGAEGDSAEAVAIEGTPGNPDFRIVVAGTTKNPSNEFDFAVAVYEEDGTPDAAFDGGTVTTDFGARAEASGVALQADGAIVVAGTRIDFVNHDFVLARYTPDGELDPTFAPGGTDGDGKQRTDFGANDVARAIAVRELGAGEVRIVVAGQGNAGTGNDGGLAAYTTDGLLDPTFGPGGDDGDGKATFELGATPFDALRGVAFQPDGKILASGSVESDGFGLIRTTPAGSLDPSFGGDGLVSTSFGVNSGQDAAQGVALAPDGRIVAAGGMLIAQNGSDFLVARYAADPGPVTTPPATTPPATTPPATAKKKCKKGFVKKKVKGKKKCVKKKKKK